MRTRQQEDLPAVARSLCGCAAEVQAAVQQVQALMGRLAFQLLASDEEDLYYAQGQHTSELLRSLVRRLRGGTGREGQGEVSAKGQHTNSLAWCVAWLPVGCVAGRESAGGVAHQPAAATSPCCCSALSRASVLQKTPLRAGSAGVSLPFMAALANNGASDQAGADAVLRMLRNVLDDAKVRVGERRRERRSLRAPLSSPRRHAARRWTSPRAVYASPAPSARSLCAATAACRPGRRRR